MPPIKPQPGQWPLHDGQPPFIRLDRGDEGIRISGAAHCDLGTPLPDPQSGLVDGVHAGWHWDGETLTARVDPLGFFSLFVWSRGNSVAVSPSPLQLIAIGADSEPDHRALAVFHRIGLFINDDTPFRHIRTLPANGRLEWRDGRATITGGPVTPPERRIDRAGAVEGFIDLPRASLRRISDAWDDDFALPLSGGRDSRHILLGLHHIGRPPRECVTFQYTSRELNAEAQAARALCQSTATAQKVASGRQLRR